MITNSFEERMAIHCPQKIQLYSANTANGIKVAAALEEIISERKLKGDTPEFDYEPHTIRIRAGENLGAVFTAMNPTQKIPVIVDPNAVTPGMEVTVPEDLRHAHSATVFESGAILMYLAERYDDLIPKTDFIMRYKAIEWTFWGSTEFTVQAKQFGFYYKYCTHKLEYCETRHRDKLIRLFGALERQLLSHNKHWITGDQYTIADLSVWPWLWSLHEVYDDCISTRFGNLVQFPHVKAWYDRCLARPASKKALDVCPFGDNTVSSGTKSSA